MFQMREARMFSAFAGIKNKTASGVFVSAVKIFQDAGRDGGVPDILRENRAGLPVASRIIPRSAGTVALTLALFFVPPQARAAVKTVPASKIVCPAKASGLNATAQQAYALGLAYEKGTCGFVENVQKAMQWYRVAAQRGSRLAAYAMGEFYYASNDGVAPDYPKAKKWFLEAARRGYGPAQLRLGFLCAEHHYDGLKPDFKAAEKWYLAAAKQNAGDAQFRLGTFYHFYKKPPELKKAVYWLTRAAEGGNRLAMFDLARMIADGEGTKKDPKKALMWITKSANLGMPAAEMQLSDMYASGTGGVKKDTMQSFIWTMKVASEPSAIPYWINKAADIIFSGTRQIAKNYPVAFRLYSRAAALGDAHAKARLGLMYLKGLGTKADPALARDYFSQAAAAGNETARHFLDGMKTGAKK